MYRNGRVVFSNGLIFSIKNPQSASFEVEEENIIIFFAQEGDFEIHNKEQHGIITKHIQDTGLTTYLFDFFKQNVETSRSFRLNADEIKKNSFALKIAE